MTNLFVSIWYDEELHKADIECLCELEETLNKTYKDRVKFSFHGYHEIKNLSKEEKNDLKVYYYSNGAFKQSFVGNFDRKSYFWNALKILELEEKKKRRKRKK